VSKPVIAVLLPDSTGLDATLSSLKAVGVGMEVVAGTSVERVIADSGGQIHSAWVHSSMLAGALDALRNVRPRVPVAVFCPETSEDTLELALRRPSVVGLLAWGPSGPQIWEVMYLARRLMAPAEAPPHMAALMPWGATTVAWQPTTTDDLRQLVTRIEAMCERLGVERRVAATVSTAAHELLMNAMYDAPVGTDGLAKYAKDRTAWIQLLPHEVPTLRFSVSGQWIGLDATDPFGRLPRNRFFEGVLRGHRAMMGSTDSALDTSHGGAGLGLHTLYASGAVLRAELTPLSQTHMSWVYDRSLDRRSRSRAPRSLYFVPNMTRSS
jgi:hypothetical protein